MGSKENPTFKYSKHKIVFGEVETERGSGRKIWEKQLMERIWSEAEEDEIE